MKSIIDYYSDLSEEEVYYQELSWRGETSSLALRLPPCVEEAARRKERIILPSSAYIDSSHDLLITKHPCFMPPYLHSHDFCELTFLLRGEAAEQIEGQDISLETGSVLLITPGYYHTVSVFDSTTIALNVLCNTSLLISLSSELGMEELSRGYTIFRRLPSEAEAYLEKIFREQCEPSAKARAVEKACFTLLLSELLSDGEMPEHIERRGESGTIYRILSYIDGHFRNVTLKEVSEEFSLTEQYLSGLFTSKLGTGFASYIRSRKLSEARRLLTTTDLSSKEIAYSLSFTAEHFSRFFKKETGVSAQEYRKLYSR